MKYFGKIQFRILNKKLKFRLYSECLNSTNLNVNILKSINYKHFQSFDTDKLYDVRIPVTDWKKLCMHISSESSDKTLFKRLPIMFFHRFFNEKKINLLDSFLSFILQDQMYHDPYIVMSILERSSNLSNTYFSDFIKLYENIVGEKESEFLFVDYMKILLKSNLRDKALKILQKSSKKELMLEYIIKTSPDFEAISVIKSFIDEYFASNAILSPSMEKSLFAKAFQDNSLINLKELFELLNGKCEYLNFEVIEQISSNFKNVDGFKIEIDTVTGVGCKNCGNKLITVDLNGNKYMEVADTLMNDIMQIHSEDKIYLSSSPEALTKFNKFLLTCHLPFDCVIDFPNVIFQGFHGLSSLDYNRILSKFARLITEFCRNNNRPQSICFIGKYLRQLKVKPEQFIADLQRLVDKWETPTRIKISHFFTDYFTKDDILALYVALKSGPNCFIITNDEFRDHRALITDQSLRTYLTEWQSVRQILIADPKFFRWGMLKMPSQLKKRISFDKINNFWHVPYLDQEIKISYQSSVKWACLTIP